MFNECISVFHPENIKENRELTKYLLLDFLLNGNKFFTIISSALANKKREEFYSYDSNR